MPRETDLRNVDFSALTGPVDPAEVAAFEAETSSSQPKWMPRRMDAGVPPTLVALAIVFIGIPAFVLFLTLLLGVLLRLWSPFIGLAPTAATLAALASFFIVPAFSTPRRRFGWEQFYRLSRFAWDNGLTFEPESTNPKYPGVMFTSAPGMTIVYNHLTSVTGRFFNIGNLRYGQPGTADTAMTDSGHRGFAAIHLGGALPHIVLDAKANNGLMGGIGASLASVPRVQLEGNFNEHFTLYCPTGYERDALYILTPDLMVDLLDESLPFDVELFKEWMFVYSMKPFDSADAATYQRLFRIIQIVGERAARRSTNYRDDQYSSPAAAAAKPGGNRMPLRLPPKLALLALAFFLSLGWIPIGLFLGVALG